MTKQEIKIEMDRDISFRKSLKNICLNMADDKAHAFNILKANSHRLLRVHWLDLWQLINKKIYIIVAS